MLPVNILIPLKNNVPLKAREKSIYEYIRIYVIMLLFNIIYSYILSISVIYLWYNYCFFY